MRSRFERRIFHRNEKKPAGIPKNTRRHSRLDIYFTRIFQPVMMRLTFLMSVGLSFWIAATVVPYFRAMAESVSPDFTVYQTAAEAGFFRSSLTFA